MQGQPRPGPFFLRQKDDFRLRLRARLQGTRLNGAMQFDQQNPTHRALFALAVAALVTFVVWGVWMSLGFILGAVGWLLSTVGSWLHTASTTMTGIHAEVALIGLGCGAIVGTVVGFSVRVDRLWERLVKQRKQSVKEAP